MTIEQVLGIVGLLMAVAAGFWRFARNQARMEMKVDIIWKFFMSRGRAEAVNKGMIEVVEDDE